MTNTTTDIFFRFYSRRLISIGKLAEMLGLSLESVKAELNHRGIPLDMGVDSTEELAEDIKNA